MPFPLFIVEPTGLERRWLRRHAAGECAAGYHDARSATLGDVPEVKDGNGFLLSPVAADIPPDSDPRWPTVCSSCGRPFTDADPRQLFRSSLYRRVDGGSDVWPLRELPAGAVYHAWWMPPSFGAGPDGKVWVVKLPGGHEWTAYGKSSQGSPWTVTGTIPAITARPSIAAPTYHGWLTDGVLSDDLDRRSS